MSRLALCALAMLLLTIQPLCAQSRLVDRPPRELFRVVKVHTLTAQTRDLAEKLEILPLLHELYQKPAASTERRAMLRSKVLETVLEAYFDAASVQAEADRETGFLIAIQDMLEQRRDRAIEYNNATNFIASGTLNTIGSILGFTDSISPFPGNFNQMMSGVVATGMSTYSLKQQSGSKAIREGSPTVLAELFGRPTNSETTYPESVWRFLHSSLHDSTGLTRAQTLERNWIKRGHLEPHNSKREKLKLDIVCGVAVNAKVMTLDDLADQISMIDDVSTVAELMTHHLRDILFSIDSDVPLEEATGDEVLEDNSAPPDKPFLELNKLDPGS